MSFPSGAVTLEESAGRLKVTIPVRANLALLALYSLALVIWIAMSIVVVGFLVRGRSTGAVLTIILILWLAIWLWFGRFLWGRWQYYAANREILFVDREQFIVRRPVSILGLTTTYDFSHVSPFYYSNKHQCPAFDYTYLHVYFGASLSAIDAQELVDALNARYFPDWNGE